MTEREFSLTKNPITSLVRDIRRALTTNKYEKDGPLTYIGGDVNIKIGGVFTSWVLRHEAVQRAIETGDKLAEAAARSLVPKGTDLGHFRLLESVDHNLIPEEGINFVLDLLFHTGQGKQNTWYHGIFTSNWIPSPTAKSDWAKISGGLADELPNASYDETNRQPAVFATVAASKEIASSTPTRFALAAGTSGITIYGSTLNSTNTVAYTGTDEVLLSAARFNNEKSGLGESDKIDIEYTIEGSST